MAGVGQDINQIIVALDFGMGYAAGKKHLVRQSESDRLLLEGLLLGTTTNQQHADFRTRRENPRQGVDKKIEAFVGVKGADEADDGGGFQTQLGPECAIRLATAKDFCSQDRSRLICQALMVE